MPCLLCGTAYHNEWRSTEQIKLQVAERYTEGPFAWLALQDANSPDSQFCTHCLNHIRKRRGKKRKTMLPADQYLLGLISPGLSTQVDMRSRKRLRRVMAQPQNTFRTLHIEPLNILMSSKSPVHTWWDLNLNTLYFRDRVTARLIRHEIKDPVACHARRDQEAVGH